MSPPFCRWVMVAHEGSEIWFRSPDLKSKKLDCEDRSVLCRRLLFISECHIAPVISIFHGRRYPIVIFHQLSWKLVIVKPKIICVDFVPGLWRWLGNVWIIITSTFSLWVALGCVRSRKDDLYAMWAWEKTCAIKIIWYFLLQATDTGARYLESWMSYLLNLTHFKRYLLSICYKLKIQLGWPLGEHEVTLNLNMDVAELDLAKIFCIHNKPLNLMLLYSFNVSINFII